ncbi:MAG TPA: hypothetical protein VK638_38905 [Edaphobacter sp.]|nr:hypothetical protein [Edaphobacter sp.]
MPSSLPALLLVGFCASIYGADGVIDSEKFWRRVQLHPGVDGFGRPANSNQDSPRRRPRPVSPPRRPVEQGFQVGLTVGLNALLSTRYAYDTQIGIPNGQPLRYSGTQLGAGGTLFGGVAITFPGPLRRVTLGANFNLGGLDSWRRPVIPTGTPTPFSQRNLQYAIAVRSFNRSAWGFSVSPYIEHDLNSSLDRRYRIGYQYWRQPANYRGSFFPSDTSRDLASYDVRLKHSSHLIRFSVNNYWNLRDPDANSSGGRVSGIIQNAGISVGTHRTIILFFGLGGKWSL